MATKNFLDYATNPMKSTVPMDQMIREIFTPTEAEIARWRKAQKANAKRMHAAIAKLKKEGKW